MSTTSKAILHRDVHSVIDADMSLDDARAAFWRMIPKEFHVTYDSPRKSARPEDLARAGIKNPAHWMSSNYYE